MMVLKRRELVAAALVVLIGVAGYLNWSYQDTMRVRDDELYQETAKKLGEAQYVNSSSVENAVESGESAENAAQTGAEITESGDSKDDAAAMSENAQENKGGTTDAASYFEQAKLDRQTSRSQAMEILKETASNESFDAEARKAAADKIVKMSEYTEAETQIENVAKAKGYKYICVYVDDSGVNIIVQKDGFSENDVVKLSEIASGELKVSSSQIKVVEYKNQ